MLTTEELHLLLTDDSGSPVPGAGYRAYAEIAALVVDLMLAGCVTVDTDDEARVHLVRATAPSDPLLAAGLVRVEPHDGEKLGDLVTRTELDPWDDIVRSLITKGIVAPGRRGIVGAGFSRVTDSEPEVELRSRLAGVLSGRIAPTVGDAVLLSLVQALGVAPHVLAAEAGGRDDAALKNRIDEVCAGVRVGGAVEEAILTTTQVIFAPVILPMFINRLI